MKLITNYLRKFHRLKKIYRLVRKGPFQNAKDLMWFVSQNLKMMTFKRKKSAEIDKIIINLSNKNYSDGSTIVITFGSRWIGNPDNQLSGFMDSYLATTRVPSRAELLIKIDHDDYLIYFAEIKEKYGQQLNIRFFTTPRGRGYEDMHIWHRDLIQHRNPSAKVHYILTDDAKFEQKFWDDELVSILGRRKDTFFIGTACTLNEAITYYGPNPVEPVPIYWIRGDDYPIYGLDLLQSIARKSVEFHGWTEFGNLQLVDQYAGALLEVAWKQCGTNLHEQINLYATRRGGKFCWSQSPVREEIRTRTLTKFFNEESKNQRYEIIQHVLSDMQNVQTLHKEERP